MNGDHDTGVSPAAYFLDEHVIIKRVVAVLSHLARRAREEGRWEAEALRRCVEFLRLFADGCHHAKEEDLLFPVMVEKGVPEDGGPIGVLRFEHRMGREFTRSMAESLEAAVGGDEASRARFLKAADEYIGLLTHHIYKEDFEFFPDADRRMSPEERQELHGRFCRVDCGKWDGKSKEDLVRIADELTTRWGG